MTRPPGSQGPRDPKAFPLARIWASLQDHERSMIAEHFGGYHDHEIDKAKGDLDQMAYEWTEKLRRDAGFVEKTRRKKR